jgi:hypothetical protein
MLVEKHDRPASREAMMKKLSNCCAANGRGYSPIISAMIGTRLVNSPVRMFGGVMTVELKTAAFSRRSVR